jgi:anti-sigma factor RsiW
MTLESNCERIRPTLLDYLMEETSTEERAAVEHHLASCSDCSRELGELRQTVTLVRRAEIQEAIPRPIRLVSEPTSGWMAFWRNPARLGFAAAGLMCVAIAMLAAFSTTVAYQNGNFQIAFGAPAVSSVAPISGKRLDVVAPASSAVSSLNEAQVKEMIASAIALSDATQRERSEIAMKTSTAQMEQRWRKDLSEVGESMRYFQAAQNVLWKGQVENQQLVSSLVQRSEVPVNQLHQ